MQKLSEYIPLIIIVGSIVFSIVGNIRKKVKEVVVLQQEVQKTDKVPVKKKQENRIPMTSKLKSVDEESTPSSGSGVSFTDTEESVPLAFDISEGDEARKMIIYAEIMNRKEY
jgi:hypothetical protein